MFGWFKMMLNKMVVEVIMFFNKFEKKEVYRLTSFLKFVYNRRSGSGYDF